MLAYSLNKQKFCKKFRHRNCCKETNIENIEKQKKNIGEGPLFDLQHH